MQRFDVTIVGGGLAGLTLACALEKLTNLSVAIIEAESPSPWQIDQYHHRVSAITLASQKIFSALGVWEEINAKRVSSFREMEVWDAQTKRHIHFSHQEGGFSSLGFIVENKLIEQVLTQALSHSMQVKIFTNIKLQAVERSEQGIVLKAENGQFWFSQLAVAADGSMSWLRNEVGIQLRQKNYHASAIVAMVETEKAHAQTARQAFLSSGSLAFLPLAPSHLNSIVWSMPTNEAASLLALDEITFAEKLSIAFDYRLGEVKLVSPRYQFPLRKQEAAHYIEQRLALIGDAAHSVHPLAGQGINMGLLDAVALAQVLAWAEEKERDIASFATLRRYERWRKADNANLIQGIDALQQLFTNQTQWIQYLRGLGLQATNKTTWIKNKLMSHAVGSRRGLPNLAR